VPLPRTVLLTRRKNKTAGGLVSSVRVAAVRARSAPHPGPGRPAVRRPGRPQRRPQAAGPLVSGRRPNPDAARVLPLGGLIKGRAAQPHDLVHLCGRSPTSGRDPHPRHRTTARLTPIGAESVINPATPTWGCTRSIHCPSMNRRVVAASFAAARGKRMLMVWLRPRPAARSRHVSSK
jgi:hypothetical protein